MVSSPAQALVLELSSPLHSSSSLHMKMILGKTVASSWSQVKSTPASFSCFLASLKLLENSSAMALVE
eukprot:CAMPEP_0205800490 /NCGR_PEP_ID=MMETSP0205-20121125/2143_1 /ASSEMBLY_ACC=CAM_ASM_000278 /TAXON_ID=36767 /ORGANISM="Euplotes focardii, Strain TN1" /LENGTH=67 /DNA_ID=CAMNT_0053063619 /DNA_START=74 /DNA_END=277 /DNA_ORIENTATION=-